MGSRIRLPRGITEKEFEHQWKSISPQTKKLVGGITKKEFRKEWSAEIRTLRRRR